MLLTARLREPGAFAAVDIAAGPLRKDRSRV